MNVLNTSLAPYTFNGSFGPRDIDYPSLELDEESQAVLIALYSAITVLSVCGNTIVITVLSCSPRPKTDLTVFLLNLALADLQMACFCIPFTFTQTMLGRWVFGRPMCPLVLFMQVTSVSVSIFTNVAIGLDRYWAVVFPLKRRLTKNRARVIVTVCWIFGISLSSIQLVIARSNSFRYNGQLYYNCGEVWQNPAYGLTYTLVVACLTYALPLALLACTYYKVGKTLWSGITPGNTHEARDRKRLQSKRKVVKMLLVIVFIFALCWLPLQVFNLTIQVAPELLSLIQTTTGEKIYYGVYYGCHWLAMANCVANPIIYGFMNDAFRSDMWYVLKCCSVPASKWKRGSVTWSVPIAVIRKDRNSSDRGSPTRYGDIDMTEFRNN